MKAHALPAYTPSPRTVPREQTERLVVRFVAKKAKTTRFRGQPVALSRAHAPRRSPLGNTQQSYVASGTHKIIAKPLGLEAKQKMRTLKALGIYAKELTRNARTLLAPLLFFLWGDHGATCSVHKIRTRNTHLQPQPHTHMV